MEKGNYHANYRLQIYARRNCYNFMSWQGEGPRRDTQARRHVLKELANSNILASVDWTLPCELFMRYPVTFL